MPWTMCQQVVRCAQSKRVQRPHVVRALVTPSSLMDPLTLHDRSRGDKFVKGMQLPGIVPAPCSGMCFGWILRRRCCSQRRRWFRC